MTGPCGRPAWRRDPSEDRTLELTLSTESFAPPLSPPVVGQSLRLITCILRGTPGSSRFPPGPDDDAMAAVAHVCAMPRNAVVRTFWTDTVAYTAQDLHKHDACEKHAAKPAVH